MAAIYSEEIAQVISGFTRGEIPDYQMRALAMAIFFRGMSKQGNLAFDQSNAGERPDIRVSTKLAAQGRQTLDRRNWRKDFTGSSTATGLR